MLSVRDPLALALWRALRNVLSWAVTSQERRARAFRPPTPETLAWYAEALRDAPDLARAFEVFAEMQRSPETADAAEVGRACHAVYMWADRQSLLGVAAHYAEAAAYADPEHPAYAVDAGWVCRRASLLARAAIWYQRAFVLAVRSRHRHDTLRSLTGYGALMQEIGNVAKRGRRT